MTIPKTTNGMQAMECVSAMQKCIRRNMEREAMEFAVELMSTSQGFLTMVCNRLEIISHEDIDVMHQPWIVPFVATSCEQAKRFYRAGKDKAARMFVGNVIRLLARANKSREGDHFHCAVGLAAEQDGHVPEVPDFALDMHTRAGKRAGRGIDHFIEVGCELDPVPHGVDEYAAECHERWRRKHGSDDGEAPRGRQKRLL